MLDEASPLCRDLGRCYLAAGHYPYTVHEDQTAFWSRREPATAGGPEAVTMFHVKRATGARHRA